MIDSSMQYVVGDATVAIGVNRSVHAPVHARGAHLRHYRHD
jgi:hypothetical protein